MKYLLLVALALVAAGCPDDDFVTRDSGAPDGVFKNDIFITDSYINPCAPKAAPSISGKVYAPNGFRVIRHKASGHRHWSKNGEIPCCPPASNYPFRKENYERAKSHCDRMCGKCIATLETEFGIVDARECAVGKVR